MVKHAKRGRPSNRKTPAAVRQGVLAQVRASYGPEEQALGWYYYLEDKIRFPFQAKCIVTKAVSPLRKGEPVELRCMAPEDACSADMLVLITWHGRNVAVPLSQLTPLEANESTTEAIRDWHYWVAQGYHF
jgi:hypothetical protein